MRRLAAATCAASIGACVATGAVAESAPRPEALPRPEAPAPDHRVYMMTDSVGLGAKNAVPAGAARLPGHGRRHAGVLRRAARVEVPARAHGDESHRARRHRGRRRRLQLPVLGSGALRPQHRQHDGRAPRSRRQAHHLGDAARGQAAVHQRWCVEPGAAVLLVLPDRSTTTCARRSPVTATSPLPTGRRSPISQASRTTRSTSTRSARRCTAG